jgi:hypothetical protein
MEPAPCDLVIHAGRVVCPASGLDGPGAVAVAGDRIAAAGPAVAGPARRVLRLPDAVLLPGLVDLHAHPARGGSKYGVDPDRDLLPFGTTTVLSQGDAGADDWERYRTEVIEASRTRVRLALNLSRRGESGAGSARRRGPLARAAHGARVGPPAGGPPDVGLVQIGREGETIARAGTITAALGEVVAQSLLAKSVQTVLVNNVDPAEAVAKAHAEIVAIYKRFNEPA